MLFADAEKLVNDALTDSVGLMSLEPMPMRARAASPAEAPIAPQEDDAEGMHVDGPYQQGTTRVVEEGPPRDDDAASIASSVSPQERGRLMYERGEDGEGLSPADPALLSFHEARAKDYPGAANCCFIHEAVPEHQRKCPYCCTTLHEQEQAARAASGEATGSTGEQEESSYLSLAASHAWPDVLEAAMFMMPQTLIQFAAGKSAFIDPSWVQHAWHAATGAL